MSTNATVSSANDELPKAVITLSVLGGALIIGLIVAKLADYFYERSSVRDDASDISEHTKEILRTQLELMRMGKNKDRDKIDKISKGEPEEQTTKAMNIWSNKVKAKGKLNPIPEATEAFSGSGPQPPSERKSPPEATKAWNEAEKNSPNPKPTNSAAATKAKPSPAKKKPGNNTAEMDDEFQVPANIAAPSKGPKGATGAKNTQILVPANLNKDVSIRAITPVSSQKSFSRYNAADAKPSTSRPTTARPTTAKSTVRPTTAKSTARPTTAKKAKS